MSYAFFRLSAAAMMLRVVTAIVDAKSITITNFTPLVSPLPRSKNGCKCRPIFSSRFDKSQPYESAPTFRVARWHDVPSCSAEASSVHHLYLSVWSSLVDVEVWRYDVCDPWVAGWKRQSFLSSERMYSILLLKLLSFYFTLRTRLPHTLNKLCSSSSPGLRVITN